MAQKKKDIVWHKKKSKFVSSSLEKSHHTKDEDAVSKDKQDHRQKFAANLLDKIKKAIRS